MKIGKPLTLADFKSDYQHLIVQGATPEQVQEFISEHYQHIARACREYVNSTKS